MCAPIRVFMRKPITEVEWDAECPSDQDRRTETPLPRISDNAWHSSLGRSDS